MSGPELKLAIKPGATPTCHTKPFQVPHHWRTQVEEGLARDVEMGIIEKLPANTPAIWCHRMVVTSKPGSPKPRRTVDMSALKEASYRLTHPGSPPFLEAQSVPAKSFKTVTDAWQGFHMIPLHPDSMQYTTFLTEWGMYRYRRMPMGDHVSMDAYNYRFDKVTEGVKNKKRCVDDSLLYSNTLEGAFLQAADYLCLMGKHGIIQNPDKLQFGNRKVEWAGFTIGEDSVKPLTKHTEAVRTYPTPVNITDLRSFTALLQQVAYCYAISPAVAPLRHLLRPSEQWKWTEEINEAFEQAKKVIAEKVEEGVKLFDPKLHTGLLTDWCQDGIGHILCQKHCDCPTTQGLPGESSLQADHIDLNCCKTGWKVISVGSRFCNSAEANYSPTDGEFTGLVDALEKTSYFTLGCKSLTVGTDHQPLIPIINGSNLNGLKTPRQIRLKEKLMRWDLKVVYIPGKNLGGTDALSRYGVRGNNDEKVNWISQLADKDSIAPWSEDTLCTMTGSQPPVIQKDILSTTASDKTLTQLRTFILKGFPETKSELPHDLQPYWRTRDMLTEYEGVIYMGDRVVVPEALRSRTLETLHAAHQGTSSMRLRAERNLFWPNMAKDIASTRLSCCSCDATAPSQSPEPPITPITPEYPFQHVCSDYFSLAGHNFCLVVDRFSNWLQVYTGKGGAYNLISLLGQSFHSFGIPETLTSDGGSEYIAGNTKEFLRKLGVHHRLSSVGFPHANQKAERSVGTAKRVIRDAVKPSGELDTVTLIRGLLQLRNTPDKDTGLSPAEMLLGRQLRDFLPGKPKPHMTSHKDLKDVWQKVAEWRELALAPRGAKMHDKLEQGTKELPPLEIGDHVMIQNQLGNKPKRWDKRGVVVQADPATRQYKVMSFGSRRLTLRNRKFLRKYSPVHTAPDTPHGLHLGNTLAQPSSSPSTESGIALQTAPVPALPSTEHTPYSQTRVCKDYSLPPAPAATHNTESARGELSPDTQQSHQAPRTLTVSPGFNQAAPQPSMADSPNMPTMMPNMSMPVPSMAYSPTVPAMMMPNMSMSTPAYTRQSSRVNKGQTTRYDDFVQQVTIKPGTYVSDGTNLYKLEDTSETNMNMNTAYIQQLPSDGYQYMPGAHTYWNSNTTNMAQNHYLPDNSFGRSSNFSGYLTNDVSDSSKDYSP